MKKLLIKQRISGYTKLFYEKHKKQINHLIEVLGMSLMFSLTLAVALDYYNFSLFIASIGVYFVYKEVMKDLKIIFFKR